MNQTSRRTLQGILWIALYLALTLAPLFLLLVGPTPPGRGFWREFSVALGFAGLAMLNLFAAPWRARFGVTAVLAMTALVAISLWRQRFKTHYDAWRVWHGILATAVVALALGHIVLVGYHVVAPWKQALWIAYRGLAWL